MWRVAEASGELDLNSSYMYLLFARDFAQTCRVAIAGDAVVGFVLGYRRPEAPDCLFIWQVAVNESHRGQGLAGRLLDDLALALTALPDPVTRMETTITADNSASQRLFAGFAERWGARMEVGELFETEHFPDAHDAERLHRIGPLSARSRA